MGFDLISPIVFTNLGLFWPNFRVTSEQGIKNEPKYDNFKKLVLRMNYYSRKNHRYWTWSFYHGWNIASKCGPFWPKFWLYDVKRIAKMIEGQIFHLKKYIGFQV